MTIRTALDAAATEPCRPTPRRVLPAATWAALPQDPALRLLALWADTVQAHALLLDSVTGAALPVSTPVTDGGYPALSPAWPVAAWFERMVHDLWGHVAAGAGDLRPWLDHGHWPHTQPLGARPGPPASAPEPPDFLPVPGDALMQLPLGPVHATIGEPAHLRLTAAADTALAAEARLGYAHKGTLLLLRGKSPRVAARYVARLSAEATVAHATAFAHAAEAATDTPAPPRAAALRAVMAELERITGHLDALSLLAEPLEAATLRGTALLHRELLHRAAMIAFGHRLMMDGVMPGGVVADINPGGPEAVRAALRRLTEALPALSELAGSAAARLDGLARIPAALADQLALGGIAGRAAGRPMDVRTACAPYAALGFVPARGRRGDAAGRLHLAVAEIAASLRLLGALLDDLPEGAVNTPLPQVSGEGVGCAESLRGDIWTWLRLDHGQIAAGFIRDPGWALWRAAEAVLTGARLEDAALICRSLGLPASGMDL